MDFGLTRFESPDLCILARSEGRAESLKETVRAAEMRAEAAETRLTEALALEAVLSPGPGLAAAVKALELCGPVGIRERLLRPETRTARGWLEYCVSIARGRE